MLHEDGGLFVKKRAVRAQMGPKTSYLIGQIETMALNALAGVLAEGRATGDWSSGVRVTVAARDLHAQISLAPDPHARGEDP